MNTNDTNKPALTGGNAGAERRLMRLEELRRDLFHAPPTNAANRKPDRKRGNMPPVEPKATYALDTLLAMLWVETPSGRLGVACALAAAPPQLGKAEAPPFAARLCARLAAAASDPLADADLPLATPHNAPMRAWAETTVAALLTDALNTAQLLLRAAPGPDMPTLEREAEVCHAVLRLAALVSTPPLTNACLRVLRVFPPGLARQASSLGQLAADLREHACLHLAALPPDLLAPFWSVLGASDVSACDRLLPLLDFMQNTSAVPYLLALLERPAVARDNVRVALAVVRALHRLGDHRALPALRRFVKDRQGDKGTWRQGEEELMREVKQALLDIEHDRAAPEKRFLLRPALRGLSDLLRPLGKPPDRDDGRADLLRSDTKED